MPPLADMESSRVRIEHRDPYPFVVLEIVVVLPDVDEVISRGVGFSFYLPIASFVKKFLGYDDGSDARDV